MIVAKSFLRYLRRRRSLSILQLLGIACGVAAVVGMTLSARSAVSSLGDAVEFLNGKATHVIQRPAGPMEEGLLTRLLDDVNVDAFAPVIDRRVRLQTGDSVRLLGIDPFLDGQVRPNMSGAGPRNPKGNEKTLFLSFLLDERAVLIDTNLSGQLRIAPGGELKTTKGVFKVLDTFPNPSGEPLILMDIAHAQTLFGLSGMVDRIDLIVKEEAPFRARWEEGFRIESNRQRKETMSALLHAFKLNLQALSLMALFVGVFLIYNTAMFAVVSRRKDAGILMSIGAHRHEIIGAFLTEIVLLGITGGALGSLLGYGLSRFLTELVGSTISSLYFFLRPAPLPWSWWNLAAGTVLGGGASLIGAISPLIDLARTEPIRALRGRIAYRGTKKKVLTMTLIALGVMILGILLLAMTQYHVYIGFAGVFIFLLGVSLLTGFALITLSMPLKWLLFRAGGIAGKLAAGNIRRNLGRTSVAVAAFMVALAMSVGLGSMIESFRHSLIWWMNSQLRGEAYVSGVGEVEVPEDFYEELKELPGMGGVDPYRNVQVRYKGSPVYLTSISASVLQRYARFGWVEGDDENWEPVKKGAIIISESLARRFAVGKGDTVTLEGSRGPARLPVAAVFYDYTTEHGLIMMDRSTYLMVFGDHTINSLGIFIDAGNPDRERIIEEVRKRAKARNLPVSTRVQLHQSILGVFDNTFAVTRSMRVLAIVVAFFGIAGALMTLFVERQREFGIYRALGFSTGQIATMTLMEGLGMGLVSFLMSIFVGTALAAILIKVINLWSFHWTIFYHFTPAPYVLALFTAVSASIGASLYPLWKVYRTYPHMQIREE